MTQFFQFIREFKIPKKHNLELAINSFSKKEWFVFIGLIIITITTTVILLQKINAKFMVIVPAYGGSINEGVIGTPRFINPLLAVSDIDKDITSLVYSGLMKKTTDNKIITDLAEKYTISDDKLTYTFTIKDNALFHNGDKVTADDIIYTINQAKDPLIKSPRKINWEGVTVNKIDDRTVSFVLKQPYASFLENATLGILPSTLWKNITPLEFSFSDLNTNGVGSGPYKIDKIRKKSSGIASSYVLSSFNKYILNKPFINNIVFYFYANEKELLSGLNSGEVKQISEIFPEEALFLKQQGYKVETSILPRVFGIFFNQNEQPIFTDKKIIEAINLGIDKSNIVENVLFGYGVPIDNALPPKSNTEINKDSFHGNKTKAKEILAKDGWTMGDDGVLKKTDKKVEKKLEFSISTGDSPELKNTVEYIKTELEQIGIKVNIKIFEIGALNQNIIRPRNYDALFFGEIIGKNTDLFSFWHSSQRNDPGLNVALYANTKVDSILEKILVTIEDTEKEKLYNEFNTEINKDLPAVFIYSPEFIYVVDNNLKGYNINNITTSSDRFIGISNWYTITDSVWKIFTKS